MTIPAVPRVHRGRPVPFTRPSVRLEPVKRCWCEVPAITLKVGDTVPGVGLLSEVTTVTDDPLRVDDPSRMRVRMRGGADNQFTVPAHTPVFAFTTNRPLPRPAVIR